MTNLLSTLLQAVLSLLLVIQAHPSATGAQQAITSATQVVQFVDQQLIVPQDASSSVQVITTVSSSISMPTIVTSTTMLTSAPNITNVDPSSGLVGTVVTLSGSGFTATGNTISFKDGPANSSLFGNVASPNGTTLSFAVPTKATAPTVDCSGSCSLLTTAGSYTVTVSNANGTSNSAIFQVIAPASSPVSPVITSLTPSSGPIGTVVIVNGSGFTASNNTVQMSGGPDGQTVILADLSSMDGTNFQFAIPSNTKPSSCPPNALCMGLPLQAGAYTITVSNQNGTSSAVTFTLMQS